MKINQFVSTLLLMGTLLNSIPLFSQNASFFDNEEAYSTGNDFSYDSNQAESSQETLLSSNVQGAFQLRSGKSFSTHLFKNEHFASQQFLYNVRQESLGLRFSFYGAAAGMKLEIGFGYDEYSGRVLGQRYEIYSREKTIFFDMSQLKHSGYQAGTLLLTVSLGKAGEYNDLLSDLSFSLTVSDKEKPRSIVLSTSRPTSFELHESNDYLLSYQMAVTNDKQPLLFTWQAEQGEPLLLVRFGSPAWSANEADYSYQLNAIQQELLLDGEEKPLSRGVWYITLLSSNQSYAKGSIGVETVKQNNLQLKTLSSLPTLSANEYENCMSALVGVSTIYGNFSGAFVSSKGHILTSLNAIKDPTGKILNDITIMITTQVQEQPIYAFKAMMIKTYEAKDLALLQLTRMAMNRQIPVGMRFPYVQVARGVSVELGQPILIAGFPVDRVRGEVSSPFILQNIVGGFERKSSAVWFKSMATPGGMGGIAFNVYYELVGVSSPVKRAGSEVISFFVPTSDIPSDWLSVIGQ